MSTPRRFEAELAAALEAERLIFQRCRACSLAWLPPRERCPRCLAAEWRWEEASGAAKLVSWVVYHHAYHAEFAARVPYTVALVELAEGPRMISTLVGIEEPRMDMPLSLRVERRDDRNLACFAPPERAR